MVDRDGQRGGAGWLWVLLPYAALALVALRRQLVLYADGAYFAFTATLSHPWRDAWREFPARAGVFVTTVLPANLLHRAGLDALATSEAYQATWLLLPPLGIVASAAFLPRDRRDLTLLPVLAWLALALPTFGFPTEAVVTLAVAFPLLFGALHPRPGASWGAWLALADLFATSHEGMVLAAPVIGLALVLGARSTPALRRRQGALGVAFVALVLAALAVAALVPPHNPLQAAAMVQNREHFGDLRILLVHPVLTAGVVTLGALALASFAPPGPVPVVAVGLALVLDALFAVRSISPQLFAPANHYVARTGVVVLLPLVLLLGIALDRTGRRPPTWAARALVVGLLVTHAVYLTTFLERWSTFRDALVAELREPAAPAVDVAGTALGVRAKADAGTRRWLWPWVLPFQSVLLRAPGLDVRRGILLDPTQWYVPIPCDRADAVVADRSADVAPAAMDAWRDDVCAK